jgi:hypothetical protein
MFYSLCIEIFVVIDFFHNFDNSSYSKNYAGIIYFACYILYYCRYFKFDLSFYTFGIINFLNKTNVRERSGIRPGNLYHVSVSQQA